jgi:hypothetical protein
VTAQSKAAVQARIMREIRLGNQVALREVDGRIVIEAVAPAIALRRSEMRVAALRRAGSPGLRFSSVSRFGRTCSG